MGSSLESFLSDPASKERFMTFTNGGDFTETDWGKIQELLGHTVEGGKIMAGAYVAGDVRIPGHRAEALVERSLTEFEQRQLGNWGLKARYGPAELEP